MLAQVTENGSLIIIIIIIIIIILYEERSENIWTWADIFQISGFKSCKISSHIVILEQHSTTKWP